MTTYHGAIKDKKTGKFTVGGEPKETRVLTLRVSPEIKEKYATIPNRAEWLRSLVEEAIINYE